MDAIDRIPTLHNKASGVREKLLNMQIAAKTQAYEHGIDPAYITAWRWPYLPRTSSAWIKIGEWVELCIDLADTRHEITRRFLGT